MKQYRFYRVKNNNGKFSTGGRCPMFTKSGKSWTASNFKKHLDLLGQHHFEYYYKDCVVEEYIFEIDNKISNPQFRTLSQLFDYETKDATNIFFERFKKDL